MFGNERPERQEGNKAVRESETRKGQVSRSRMWSAMSMGAERRSRMWLAMSMGAERDVKEGTEIACLMRDMTCSWQRTSH